MIEVRLAHSCDFDSIVNIDYHMSKKKIAEKLNNNEYYVISDYDKVVGCLRYNIFWDTYPFINFIYIVEEYQGRGLGGRLIRFWESEMRLLSHDKLLTSTQANESSQYFFRKQGYCDIGSMIFPNEWMELILIKDLNLK